MPTKLRKIGVEWKSYRRWLRDLSFLQNFGTPHTIIYYDSVGCPDAVAVLVATRIFKLAQRPLGIVMGRVSGLMTESGFSLGWWFCQSWQWKAQHHNRHEGGFIQTYSEHCRQGSSWNGCNLPADDQYGGPLIYQCSFLLLMIPKYRLALSIRKCTGRVWCKHNARSVTSCAVWSYRLGVSSSGDNRRHTDQPTILQSGGMYISEKKRVLSAHDSEHLINDVRPWHNRKHGKVEYYLRTIEITITRLHLM